VKAPEQLVGPVDEVDLHDLTVPGDRWVSWCGSRVRASESQRASGQKRPAWPGNAMNVLARR
jgi:hypothetical protein